MIRDGFFMSTATNDYVMTIDAGTGSGRALIFDLTAKQIGGAQREWTLPTLKEYPGSAVFDTRLAWDLICQCIQEALDTTGISAGQIKAIAPSSMREGMVLYDHEQHEIWACPNIDARARDEAEQLVAEGTAQRIYDTGGDWVGIISAPRFRWLARHQRDIFEQMQHMSMISDWVVARLSGQIVTDPSCGSSSGLFDLKSGNWSAELLTHLQLPETIFPPIHPPGTVVGEITSEAAAQTSLHIGTPVIVGGADTQLALLGTGGVKADRFTIVGGTFWQTTWLANHALIDPQCRLRTLCHALPGLWMTEGIGFLNGLAMRWLRDTVCDTTDSLTSSPQDKDPYVAMERLAESVPPGADGVFALVSEVMNARRWVQAPTSFVGLDVTRPEHAGRRGKGLMVRAVQESAAFTALGHYRILESLSEQQATEMVFCGGASKGKVWSQIMADVFDMPVKIPVVKETTSLGAAFCALVGLGQYASLTEAAESLVRWDRTVDPINKHVTRYKEISSQALELQSGLIDWVEDGRLSEMWRAAGVPPFERPNGKVK